MLDAVLFVEPAAGKSLIGTQTIDVSRGKYPNRLMFLIHQLTAV